MVRGYPGAALGEHDEGVEEGAAVFGGGGQVAADRAELSGSGEGARTAVDRPGHGRAGPGLAKRVNRFQRCFEARSPTSTSPPWSCSTPGCVPGCGSSLPDLRKFL